MHVILIGFWWFFNEKFCLGYVSLHFGFVPEHIPTQNLGKLPPPLDCDVSTENAKTVLSITCMGLKKSHCSNSEK